MTREKLEELYGYSGLSRYEALLAERDAPKRVSGPGPESTESAELDPQVIEGTATEIKPAGERW